jgi:outer membrane protein TolC
VATEADLLRLQVALENARQQEIQAHAQEDVAYTSLLTLMGLPADLTTLEFKEPAELEAESAPLAPLPDALVRAEKHRPELEAMRLQARAATQRSRSRFFQLLPEINLEAAYANVQGQAFAPKDSAYVGLRADWNVWEWGASYYAWRSSAAQSAAAKQDAENARQQSALEVSARLLQARSALSAVDGAKAAVASAEEAYRVTDALVKAGSATTTDLLDAQAALTQARLNLVKARYEQALARVSLTRAVGG